MSSLGQSEVVTIIPVFQVKELGLREPYELFQYTVTEHTIRVGPGWKGLVLGMER